MKSTKARWTFLIVTGAAYALWIIYLAGLALSTQHPVVLSRPQFLVSNLDVIAKVEDRDSGRVRIETVHWPHDEQEKLAGKEIVVTNLSDCDGWVDAEQKYILPLMRGSDTYRVAPVPRSPGLQSSTSLRPRIYPATPETLRQLDEVHKAFEP
jgi:hypothetical protein